LRKIQLADHGIARLVEDVMAGARLCRSVCREKVIVHNDLEMAILVGKFTLDDLEDQDTRF
jgi:hypothetical protein